MKISAPTRQLQPGSTRRSFDTSEPVSGNPSKLSRTLSNLVSPRQMAQTQLALFRPFPCNNMSHSRVDDITSSSSRPRPTEVCLSLEVFQSRKCHGNFTRNGWPGARAGLASLARRLSLLALVKLKPHALDALEHPARITAFRKGADDKATWRIPGPSGWVCSKTHRRHTITRPKRSIEDRQTEA
jgi:hypothetical protein